MRRDGSTGDDHVTEALGGRFQPEDTHIDEVVMEKTMGGIMGIQVVKGERRGRRGPFRFHSIASFHTALGTSI